MTDSEAKKSWERDNVIKITVKINRTQHPKLYELFTREEGSHGALAKALMSQALEQNRK